MAKAKQQAAPQGTSVKQAAADLGVAPSWVRQQIASGAISPARTGSKRNGRFTLTAEEIETLRQLAAADPATGGPAALARVTQLEAERANLLAQVAWERAIAQEQQKALETERARAERLAADLDAQRARIEQLKALTAWDRVLGRHKAI